MPLRNLRINVTLRKSTTGQAAKEEHARVLRAVLAMIEDPKVGEFDLPLYNSIGQRVGQVRCWRSTTESEEATNQYGDSQRIAARAG